MMREQVAFSEPTELRTFPPTGPHYPDLIAVTDTTGRVLSVRSTDRTVGDQLGLATWVGQSLFSLMAMPQPDLNSQLWQQPEVGDWIQPLEAQFVMQGQSMCVTWFATPCPDSTGDGARVVWLGYIQINDRDVVSSDWSTSDPSSNGVFISQACAQLQNYGDRLNQITRNIRWTLNLETIWRQTVDGLGELFEIDQCSICSYEAKTQTIYTSAEYRRPGTWAEPGGGLTFDMIPCLDQALQSLSATNCLITLPDHRQVSAVVVATRYQEHVNGLILLAGVPERQWSEVELRLITDLADQVGTAVAHALLFGESHALALQLQQANASLMEKQREFEEARRQAEEVRQQAEEASRLKSEFLANTSHELRTPLNGMIGFLKLVLDGMADDPAEQEEFIQEAHKSALHLLNLINDVLDIAKIEAGKMQIDMVPVNLRELLEDVENFTRPQAEQKGLTFEILMPLTRDEIILNGNYQRLLQVMLNLVGNAIKFTHEGGITISAEIKPQKIEYQDKTWSGTVKVSVADTGIGVSLEKQDKLFQTFSQVDGERTRQYGGTGLGLAISQRLVEAMGGVVQFISMGEGLGSTVTFTVLLYQEPVMITEDPVAPVS